eukprot:1151759-Pleurochrysis_carterae.AAC.1
MASRKHLHSRQLWKQLVQPTPHATQHPHYKIIEEDPPPWVSQRSQHVRLARHASFTLNRAASREI